MFLQLANVTPVAVHFLFFKNSLGTAPDSVILLRSGLMLVKCLELAPGVNVASGGSLSSAQGEIHTEGHTKWRLRLPLPGKETGSLALESASLRVNLEAPVGSPLPLLSYFGQWLQDRL